MKNIIRRTLVLAVLFMTAFANSYAQQSADVEAAMNKIVTKYEDTKDVSCITISKGFVLNRIKKAFAKEFGKDFMKGVTSMSIIEYSDASQETVMSIRKDLDSFTSLLNEFDVSDEKNFSDNSFVRCFALKADDKLLSDFLIAMEDADAKMVLYMAGVIKIQ